MDIVLKLRELRRLRGLSQKDVALLSGVGHKTISSFETGDRIGALKLSQLRRLLKVYGMTEKEFFGGALDRKVAPWEFPGGEEAERLFEELGTLPEKTRKLLLTKMRLMIEQASESRGMKRQPATQPLSHETYWQLLNGRN